MRSNPYTGTVKTPSANTQSQWKTGGNEQNKVHSTGPNREMASTVKLNTSKPAVTAPNTAVSTVKPTGPNVQMGGITQSANKPLTKAQLEKLVYGMTGGVGPGRETAQTRLEGNPKKLYDAVKELPKNTGLNREISRTRLEGNPQAFYSAVENVQENKGISNEAGNAEYIDSSGINPAEKAVAWTEEKIEKLDKAIQEKNKNSYNYLLDMPPASPENYDVIETGNNIYYVPLTEEEKTLKTVESELKSTLAVLKNEKVKIEQNQRLSLGMNGEKMDTAEVDRKIAYLEEVESLIDWYKEYKTGELQQYIYDLAENGIYDKIESGELYEQTYNSNFGQALRSASNLADRSILFASPLENIVTESRENNNVFSVYDSRFPDKKINFELREIKDKNSYKPYKIVIEEFKSSDAGKVLNAVAEKIENVRISESARINLVNLFKNSDKISNIAPVLSAVGTMFDLYEIAFIIGEDDAGIDSFEKETVQQIGGKAGEIAGSTVGASLGAKAGAAIGTVLIPVPGVGTVVGSAVGGVIGSLILSEIGEILAEYMIGELYGIGGRTLSRDNG